MTRYRVVVGADLSVSALAAVRWAAQVAAAHDGELIVVHAVDPSQRHRAHYATIPPPRSAELRRRAAQEMDRVLTDLFATMPPVPLCRRYTVDLPARALLSAARGADLLVVGTRRRSGENPVLGSTPRTIMLHPPCPVAVVPEQWVAAHVDLSVAAAASA